MDDISYRLHSLLGEARRSGLTFRAARKQLATAFDEWAFDQGLLLLKLHVEQSLRRAQAVLVVYEDHSEMAVKVG